jgi:hypothetical protein
MALPFVYSIGDATAPIHAMNARNAQKSVLFPDTIVQFSLPAPAALPVVSRAARGIVIAGSSRRLDSVPHGA